MLVLNFVNIFINNTVLNIFLSIMAIVMIGFAFVKASKTFKTLGIVFIIIGIILFTTSNAPLIDTIYPLTDNFSLLTLFMMLPWMNTVIRAGLYDKLLSKIMKLKTENIGTLYNRSSISTFSLASLLNLPAVTISQSIITDNLKAYSKKFTNSFINRSSVRAYSMALLWSPLEILVAVSIFVTDVKYMQVLPWLLLILLIIFTYDNLLGKIKFKKIPYESDQKLQFTPKNKKRLIGLVVALILFLAVIMLFGEIPYLDFTMTITLLIFPFAFLWSFVIKRHKRYLKMGFRSWKNSTNNMHNFIVLFISLSLFSSSISASSAESIIQSAILSFSDVPIVLLFVIQLFILVMSLFGVHSVASIGILTGVIPTIVTFIDPVSLAIVLITSSVSSFSVSTYGLLITITAVYTEQNPYRITFENIIFALIFGSIGTLLAFVLLFI